MKYHATVKSNMQSQYIATIALLDIVLSEKKSKKMNKVYNMLLVM